MIKHLSLFLLLLLLCLLSFSQQSDTASCGQKELMQQFYKTYPEYKKLNDQVEKLLAARNRQINAGQLKPQKINAVVTLPVVVHIIHNNGSENISNAQVLQGIQHLNEAFANSGYYDPANGVNTQIQFCMAQRDPANNATNGITRDVSANTVMSGANYYADDQKVKNINRWDPYCYINIWLVKSIPTSVVGYAYMPSAHGTSLDGIIEEAAYFGSSYPNDVVVVHEMGHFLGLYHTFEGACTNNDCSSDGDKVCDTPPDQSTAGISCTGSVNSCTTDALSGFATDQNDLTQDYMDYGNFNCMKVFTAGQAARMNYFIQNVRQSLPACKSCMNPCPAPVIANFTIPALPFTAGTAFLFTNSSVNATGYEWWVNGVLQSTTLNFNYTLPAVGTYVIKLIAKSGNALCDEGTKSITINAVCGVTTSFTKSASVAAAGTNINFTNASAGATGYEWFVNGILQNTTTNFFYTSSSAGRYIVKLVAKNTLANCQQEFTDTVDFTCTVIPDFTPLTHTIIANTAITFTSTGTGATVYQWLINGVVTGTGPTLTHNFALAGSYSIQLIAGNGSCSATKYGLIYVADTCGNAQYLFQKNYAAGLLSGANDIRSTSDGGSIIALRMITNTNANLDEASLMKLDAGGNVQWLNSYNNYGNSYFLKVKQTADGGYIAIGYIATTTGNTAKIYIVKALASGAIEWSREFATGDGADTRGADILQSADGSYYFTGTTVSPGSLNGVSDVVAGKSDATGNIVWMKTYDARASEEATGLAEDNTGIIICGNKTGQITTGFLLNISKTDGNVVWSKTYESTGENFKNIMVTPDGYYVNILRRIAAGGLFTDHVYMKTDFTGTITYSSYTQPFGATKASGWASSFIKSNGNIISLTTGEFGGIYVDFLLQEIDPRSGILWTKKYNRPNTWMGVVSIAAGDGILMAGTSLEITTPPIQTYVMKLDSSGNAGSCPAEETGMELLPVQYITGNADFTAKYVQLQIITEHLSTPVPAIANTVCQYITCDSVPPPADTCRLCTTLQLSGADSVCSMKDTISFTATKNGSCLLPQQWTIDSAFAKIIPATDSTIRIQFKKTGTVKLYVAFKGSCNTAQDSLLITILSSPSLINLGPDMQLCTFSTLKLSAGSGFKKYLWNDGSVDSVLTAYNPGPYFVTAEDYCGNKFYDTVNISQAPNVAFDLGPDLKKCNNDTLIITAPGSFLKYNWSPSYNINTTNGNTVKIWPGADTGYTVIAEVAKGCTVVDTIRIKVAKSLPIHIGNDTSFCIGGKAVFKVPGGFAGYVWQDASAGTSYTATLAGTYFVQVTDTNGCVSKDTARVINVHSLPVVSLGSDIEICQNETHTFNAGSGFTSYLWQDKSTNSNYTTSLTGTYWVEVTNNNNCRIADTVLITAYKPVPRNFLDSTAWLCVGKNIVLTVIGTWSDYIWSNNAVSTSITVTNPGNYWLQVSNTEGCSARDTIAVKGINCQNSIYFPNAFTPNNDLHNDTYRPIVNGDLALIKFSIYDRYGTRVFETSNILESWNGSYKGRPQNPGAFVWYCMYQFAGGMLRTEKGTVVLVR